MVRASGLRARHRSRRRCRRRPPSSAPTTRLATRSAYGRWPRGHAPSLDVSVVGVDDIPDRLLLPPAHHGTAGFRRNWAGRPSAARSTGLRAAPRPGPVCRSPPELIVRASAGAATASALARLRKDQSGSRSAEFASANNPAPAVWVGATTRASSGVDSGRCPDATLRGRAARRAELAQPFMITATAS